MKHDGAPSHRNQESLVQLFGQNLERLATATLSAALDEDPALQEEGALQYLIDVAHMELDSRPGRALGIMQAVMPFADVADVVPGDPVASMLFRASALKVYALALRLTDPAKAEQAIRTAVGMVDERAHPVLNARLRLVQAIVLDASDDSETALELARAALLVFEEHADLAMALTARQIEGAVLTALHREMEAYEIFVAALFDARSLGDATSETRLLNNLGLLLFRQGRFEDASEYFSLAATRFREAGMFVEAARVRWGKARILLSRRQYPEALEEFKSLHADMEGAGSGIEAVTASLDIARTLILLDRQAEARTICFEAADWFSAAGFPANVAKALECLRTAWPASDGGQDRHEPARLSAFAEQQAREDADAELVLGGLLDRPDLFERTLLARKKLFQSAGVARRLCKVARAQCAEEPLVAMNLAAAATRIANDLIEDGTATEAIHEVLGQASVAYGSAALSLNRLDEAMEAFTAAESACQYVPDPDDLLASVQMGRAVVYWSTDEWEEALVCVRRAASTFTERHDMPRLFEAKQIEALVLERMGGRSAGLAVYEMMYAFAKTMNDRELEGRAALNLASARLEAGDVAAAKSLFGDALQILDKLGAPAAAARARQGTARCELVAGRPEDAAPLFRMAATILRKLGSGNEAAMATLYLVEALLMLEKDEEVSTILTSLVTSFRSASTVDGAGRAALFLADKARTGLLTLADLQHVRNYIAELQRLPDLVFVPAAG